LLFLLNEDRIRITKSLRTKSLNKKYFILFYQDIYISQTIKQHLTFIDKEFNIYHKKVNCTKISSTTILSNKQMLGKKTRNSQSATVTSTRVK